MRAVIIGEAMFEYRARSAAGEFCYGGDTLNTGIHLSRLGIEVSYVTALGGDGLSDRLCEAWQGEGIDTRHVLRHPSRQPGIYAIQNDASGERSFLYWRDQSAAREVFSLPGIAEALQEAADADLFYFSLISLAILPPPAREALLQVAAARRRRGLQVAFDGNYRPLLWTSSAETRLWSERACAVADIGLPTWSDETQLWDSSGTAEAIGRAWLRRGCQEVAVKTGAEGCVLLNSSTVRVVRPERPLQVLDSSGAGDAFNAGYLAARLRGADLESSARCGQSIAEWVIQRPGAAPAIDAQAPYAAWASD